MKRGIEERDGRYTNVNLVPFEISPIECILVEADDCPVDGEPIGLIGGNANGVSMQDLANTSRFGVDHKLGDAGVEAVQLLYAIYCIVNSLLGNLERPGNPISISYVISLLLLQPLDLPVLRHDDLLEGANSSLDQRDTVLEGFLSEGNDLLAILVTDLV